MRHLHIKTAKPSPVNLRARLTRLVGIGAVVALLVAASISAPAHAVVGTRCGFATVIGVRGSDEPAGSGSTNSGRTYASEGLGNVIRNFAIGMQSDRNIPVFVEALNYPANVLDPANLDSTNYLASLNIGANNLRSEIEDLARNCPQTNILLAGYSQGAHVINNVLINAGGLSSNAKAHVRAVVMFGSPTYHAGEGWNDSQSGSSHGLLGVFGNPDLAQYAHLAWLPPSYTLGSSLAIRSYCLSGDFFCQTNLTPNGRTIHESYPTSSVMLRAQLFVKGWLTDDN